MNRGPGRRDVLRWLAACAVGEAVGLVASGIVAAVGVPAVAGALGTAQEPPSPALLRLLMVAAGALEGACLGLAQWWALRRFLPELGALPFVGSTAAGFAVGWLIGTLTTALEPAGEPSTLLLILFAALAGLALGAVVGLAQAVVLWPHAAPTGPWVGSTALAWTLGLGVSSFGASLLPPGPYDLVSVAIGLGTGAAVGGVVGVVTLFGLCRLHPTARIHTNRK